MDVTQITDGTRIGSGVTIGHRYDEGSASHEYILRHGCSKVEMLQGFIPVGRGSIK